MAGSDASRRHMRREGGRHASIDGHVVRAIPCMSFLQHLPCNPRGRCTPEQHVLVCCQAAAAPAAEHARRLNRTTQAATAGRHTSPAIYRHPFLSLRLLAPAGAMLPGRSPLLLAAALLAALAAGLDAAGDAIGIPALQAGGGRAAAAAAAASAAAAHRLSLHAQQQLGGQLSEPRARSLQQAGGTGSSAATDGGPRCPPLSREVLAARAHHNTVMLAVVSPGLAVLGWSAATRLGCVENHVSLHVCAAFNPSTHSPMHPTARCRPAAPPFTHRPTTRSGTLPPTGCTSQRRQASRITSWRPRTRRPASGWRQRGSPALSGLTRPSPAWVRRGCNMVWMEEGWMRVWLQPNGEGRCWARGAVGGAALGSPLGATRCMNATCPSSNPPSLLFHCRAGVGQRGVEAHDLVRGFVADGSAGQRDSSARWRSGRGGTSSSSAKPGHKPPCFHVRITPCRTPPVHPPGPKCS